MVEDRQDDAVQYGESMATQAILCLDAAVEDVFTHMLRAVCVVAADECAGDRVCASILMGGEPAAECVVEVPVAAGDRITDALLGSEADWDAEMIDDAVGELCNMIAGGLKRRLGMTREGSCLSLPVVWRRSALEAGNGRESSVRRVYLFGEDRICATLTVG